MQLTNATVRNTNSHETHMGNATNRARIREMSTEDDGAVRNLWSVRVSEPRRTRDTIAPVDRPVERTDLVTVPRSYPRGTQPPDRDDLEHEFTVAQNAELTQLENATVAEDGDLAIELGSGENAAVDVHESRKRGRGIEPDWAWVRSAEEAMKRRGWDQAELAKQIGKNKSAMTRLFKHADYTDLVATKVSAALDIAPPKETSGPMRAPQSVTAPPTIATSPTESFALQRWSNVGQRLLSRSGSTFNRVLQIAEKYLDIEEDVYVKLRLHEEEARTSDK